MLRRQKNPVSKSQHASTCFVEAKIDCTDVEVNADYVIILYPPPRVLRYLRHRLNAQLIIYILKLFRILYGKEMGRANRFESQREDIKHFKLQAN